MMSLRWLQTFTIVGFIAALLGWGWVMKLLIDQMAKWNALRSWQKTLYCSVFLLFLFLALNVLLKFNHRFDAVFGRLY